MAHHKRVMGKVVWAGLVVVVVAENEKKWKLKWVVGSSFEAETYKQAM